MQIVDSSSMRHTSGGLPFKLQKKKSQTDREKEKMEDENHFQSNLPKTEEQDNVLQAT